MSSTQSITFQGVPVVGMDGRLRRGTAPGVFRIRVPHAAAISALPGVLTFDSGHGVVLLAKCIPDLSTLQTEFRNGRREYRLLVRDRRHCWPGRSMTGRFNRRYRDNSIETVTRATTGEIANLCLAAAGETSGATDLGATYPYHDWDDARPNECLDAALKLVPAYCCRSADDVYEIFKTDIGDGIDASWPLTTPNYLANLDTGPRTIRVLCAKTWFGCTLELEAVGLDTDGEYKVLGALSYTPSAGWGNEWPTLFSGVSTSRCRSLAFDSVFRCYRVRVPQTTPFGYSILALKDIDLDSLRLVPGQTEPPPAYVSGEFWPMGDHPYNTANCPQVACDFEFDIANKLIKFEYPIIKMDKCIAPADLKLHTSFHLRDNITEKWIREVYSVDRADGEGTWTIEVPHLWRAMGVTYLDCSPGATYDNQTNLDAEAQAYLNLWQAHFEAVRNKRDVSVAGIHKVGLTGKIAQIDYRLGRGLPPKTRVAVHYEPTR